MFRSMDHNIGDHEKTMKKKATIIANGTEIKITRTAKKTAVPPCQDRGFFGSGNAVSTHATPLPTHKITPAFSNTDMILSIAMPACDNDPGNIGSSGPSLSQFQLSAIKGIISHIKPKRTLSLARFWALSLSGVSIFSSYTSTVSKPLIYQLGSMADKLHGIMIKITRTAKIAAILAGEGTGFFRTDRKAVITEATPIKLTRTYSPIPSYSLFNQYH